MITPQQPTPQEGHPATETPNCSNQRKRLGGDDSLSPNNSPTPSPAEASRLHSDQRERLGGDDSLSSNNSPTPPPAEASRPHSDQRERLGGDDSLSPNNSPTPPPAEALGLIPVRMLNEFAYCPRLGYLEYVHGEWEDNLETKQGTFGHRRVDKADRRNIPAAHVSTSAQATTVAQSNADETQQPAVPESAGAPTIARSTLLSAPNEGLIAKLDLLEIDGSMATPVDYKRGKAPRVSEGAYEPERVQLCAQGLILRENGFESNEGVLYFIASKKRMVIPFTNELIARTRQLREEFGRVAADDVVPPPLVDSPKCPRCSLVGICLPDEVVYLNSLGPGTEKQVAACTTALQGDRGTDSTALKDLPDQSACSSAEQVCNLSSRQVMDRLQARQTKSDKSSDGSAPSDQRERLGGVSSPTSKDHRSPRKLLPARDNALPFYVQDFGAMLGKSGDRLQVKKKGEVIGERRLKDVSQISLFGSVIMSSQALSEVMARGIPVCHFSHGGWFHGITTGLVHKNVHLRLRQYEAATHEGEAVRMAREMISGKIRNCRTFLRRHLGTDHKPLLNRLDSYRRKAETTINVNSLLGIEGMAAKEYFSGLFELLRGRHNFDVNDRNRRPPRDPVNAVLSFVYALLTKELTVVVQAVGFDPMLGVFHQPRYGRPSLALDLAEEYRPLIADSVMLTAFNNGELTGDHFLERAGAVTLTGSGRSAVISAFERRMTTEITHPIFGYKVSYRRLLEVQSRLLARTLLGEIEKYPAFCTR